MASKLFEIYVENYKHVYGFHSIGSNVHNLIHIVEDLENCDVENLIQISTYKYENALRLLGLKIKHSNRPLEQVVCRIIEQNKLKSNCESNINYPIRFKPQVWYEFKFENRRVFKKIEIASNVILSSRKSNDSWFLTKFKEIVKFEFANGIDFKLYGRKIKEKQTFFDNPISSAKLDIYESDGLLEENLHIFNVESIEAKMMCLSCKSKFVFIPLLHSMENLKK